MGGLKPTSVNIKRVYSEEQQASLPQMETLFLGCEESQGRKKRDATGHWGRVVTSQDGTPSPEREGMPLVGSMLKSLPKKEGWDQAKKGLQPVNQFNRDQDVRDPSKQISGWEVARGVSGTRDGTVWYKSPAGLNIPSCSEAPERGR